MSTLKVNHVFLISRSDPNEIVSIGPGDKRSTRLEEVRKGYGSRADIVLVNLTEQHCPTCTCDNGDIRQACVFVTESGKLTGDGLRYLNTEQLRWAEHEAQELMRVCEQYPEMKAYLV